MICYALIWFDIIWYDMIWDDLIWCDMIWYDLIWYDLIWFDMIWYDLIWFDMVWYDLVWFGQFPLGTEEAQARVKTYVGEANKQWRGGHQLLGERERSLQLLGGGQNSNINNNKSVLLYCAFVFFSLYCVKWQPALCNMVII